MGSADTDGLFGSVLIYVGAISFSMAVLVAPIYFVAAPNVIVNNEASDFSRVVEQPVLAANENRQPNPKAEAALKALVKKPRDTQLRAEVPVHRRAVAHSPSTNQVTSTLPAVFPSLAPL